MECLDYTWPDDATQTLCEVIDPSFLQLTDAIALGLMGIATVGLVLAVTCQVAFVHFRGKQLIKASSKELSALTLCGICTAFLGVFSFVAKPNVAVCIWRPLIFHLAVSMMYAPTLVKMARIYRIFTGARTGMKYIRFTSSGLQVIFSLVLFGVQVSVVL